MHCYKRYKLRKRGLGFPGQCKAEISDRSDFPEAAEKEAAPA